MASVSLANEKLLCSSSDALDLESPWIPISSPTFHGPKSMINFENVYGGDATEIGDEDYDWCFHHPGKKRRLTIDQVKYLERNFEVENKLEPDRKVQLAKKLGLQPRQIAVWFQNRRARFKTKQLEKDYNSLKSNFDKLKADYDFLLMEEKRLKDEILSLQERLNIREKGKGDSEPLNDMNSSMDESGKEPSLKTVPENVANIGNVPKLLVCKQEDASSAVSDVCDLESPHCIDRKHSSMLETADCLDCLHEEDENIGKTLSSTRYILKLEEECYHDSYNFGFPVEEDQPFCFWPY